MAARVRASQEGSCIPLTEKGARCLGGPPLIQLQISDISWKDDQLSFRAERGIVARPQPNSDRRGKFDPERVRSYALRSSRRTTMAKLALIYGMRLLPEEDLGEVKDATVVLKNGRSARVTMHLIEGSKEEIEKTFHQSIEAFFEMYPEI